jgi:hypothetical protein
MRSLLWKEWREQSWKLAFGCVVLAALALIGLRARVVADDTMVMTVCFVAMTLLPVLSSTGLVPAERSEGSFDALVALPVQPWRIFLAKMILGLLLCVVPLLLAGVASVILTRGREMTGGQMIDLYVRSTLATVSLFLWMVFVTIRLPSEGRAALVAMGMWIIWALATIGLGATEIPSWLRAISPLAFVHGIAGGADGLPPPLLLVLFVQAVIAAGLWFGSARRLIDIKG